MAVQGANAVREVCAALSELDADPLVDVIVLARGGGSFEDLLPFSDESLVRAVAAAHTPVVSAIGHEADSPIVDAVADVRASTPTDAGKRIVPDVAEEFARISEARGRIDRAIAGYLSNQWQYVQQLRQRPVFTSPGCLPAPRMTWAGAPMMCTVYGSGRWCRCSTGWRASRMRWRTPWRGCGLSPLS